MHTPFQNKMEVTEMYIIASEHGHYARFSSTDALYKTENREEASVFPNRDSAIYTLKKCAVKLNNYYVINRETGEIAYRSKGKEKRKSIPVETRKIIYKQSGGRCAICGKQIDFNEMELDHINPVSLGGNSSQSNLQCCCVPCNRMKGNLPPEEFNTKTISIFISIFMWQMDKRYHSKLSWKMANKIINRMVL